MRDYSKISPQFWLCNMGRKLRTMGSEAQLVALYLMSSPHSTMTGIYYIPYLLIAHETGLTNEKVREVMQQLIECQFCSYDETYEFVWVHEMARCQIAPYLKPNDNRVKTVNKFLAQLPALSFLNAFLEAYQEDFHLQRSEEKKPLHETSQEISYESDYSESKSLLDNFNEKDMISTQTVALTPELSIPPLEKETPEPIQEKISEAKALDLPPGVSPSIWISAQCIFEHWKKLSGQVEASLSPELLKAMHRAMVNGFTEQQLIRVCNVCIERNLKATDFELLHLLSQRVLLEEALGIAPQPKPISEMAYQFLNSVGDRYGAATSPEL